MFDAFRLSVEPVAAPPAVGDRERQQEGRVCLLPLRFVVDACQVEHGIEILCSLTSPGRGEGVPNRLGVGHVLRLALAHDASLPGVEVPGQADKSFSGRSSA